MPSEAHDPDQTPAEEVLSRTRRFWKRDWRILRLLWSALIAVRDLWVAEPPEPPVAKGEDCDAP